LPCIPWGTPTLSDSDKLEWKSGSDELIAQLALQLANSNDFSSGFGELTEVDAGANVNVVGGHLEIDGSNAWDVNGVASTALVSVDTPHRWTVEMTPHIAVEAYTLIFSTCTTAGTLNRSDSGIQIRFQNTGILVSQGGANINIWGSEVNDGETYTLELEVCPDGYMRIYITGETHFTTRTMLAEHWAGDMIGGNVGCQIQQYRPLATAWDFDNYQRYSGYDTGGEYMQFVADAGAGLGFYGLDFSNMALPSGLTGTNLKYAYSYDDGTPSYNGSWLTLAQLQAVGAVSGNKRYIRLRVQLNSDGDTQEYGAAVNADDGISGVFAQPSSDIIAPGEVVNAVTGDMDLPELENVLNTDTLRGEAGTYSPSATTSQTKTGVRYARSGVR